MDYAYVVAYASVHLMRVADRKCTEEFAAVRLVQVVVARTLAGIEALRRTLSMVEVWFDQQTGVVVSALTLPDDRRRDEGKVLRHPVVRCPNNGDYQFPEYNEN